MGRLGAEEAGEGAAGESMSMVMGSASKDVCDCEDLRTLVLTPSRKAERSV